MVFYHHGNNQIESCFIHIGNWELNGLISIRSFGRKQDKVAKQLNYLLMQDSVENLLLLFFACFLISLCSTWVMIKIAALVGLIDKPNDRSSHNSEVPKGGGVGLILSFLMVAIYLNISFWFWFPILVMSVIAFCGDVIEISAMVRLIAQIIIVGLLLSMNWHFAINSSWKNIIIYVFFIIFIVATTNYYNFMDGIDGMASVCGVVGYGLLFVYLVLIGRNYTYCILAISMSIACLAFIPFNLFRAKIFMGDVGSIFLGSLYASIIFVVSNNITDYLCLISFFFPFFADEFTTTVERLKRKENLLKAHRKHIYQILANEYKIPHWKVALGYSVSQLLIGLLFLAMRGLSEIILIGFLFLLTVCVFVLRITKIDKFGRNQG